MDTEPIGIYMTKATPNFAQQSSQESRTLRISIKLLGSLSKDADCDGNENVKPEISLD